MLLRNFFNKIKDFFESKPPTQSCKLEPKHNVKTELASTTADGSTIYPTDDPNFSLAVKRRVEDGRNSLIISCLENGEPIKCGCTAELLTLSEETINKLEAVKESLGVYPKK